MREFSLNCYPHPGNVRVNSFNLVSHDIGDLESLTCNPDVLNVTDLQYIYVGTQQNDFAEHV